MQLEPAPAVQPKQWPPLRIAGRSVAKGVSLRVAALGKAAAGMADALMRAAGDRVVAGLVVTKDGHADGFDALPVREAAHPVPDTRSERAAREVLALAREGSRDDMLLVLLSGGASALTARSRQRPRSIALTLSAGARSCRT